MITPDQIPDEAVEAAAVDVATIMGAEWGKLHEDDRNIARSIARAAAVAIINSWPGEDGPIFPDKDGYLPGIFLSLPQEK